MEIPKLVGIVGAFVLVAWVMPTAHAAISATAEATASHTSSGGNPCWITVHFHAKAWGSSADIDAQYVAEGSHTGGVSESQSARWPTAFSAEVEDEKSYAGAQDEIYRAEALARAVAHLQVPATANAAQGGKCPGPDVNFSP